MSDLVIDVNECPAETSENRHVTAASRISEGGPRSVFIDVLRGIAAMPPTTGRATLARYLRPLRERAYKVPIPISEDYYSQDGQDRAIVELFQGAATACRRRAQLP
jgi:hypothetical protein